MGGTPTSFMTGIGSPPPFGIPTADPNAPDVPGSLGAPGGNQIPTWYDPEVFGSSSLDSGPLAPSAITTGPNPPSSSLGGFGSLDLGSFLNSVGVAIRKALPSTVNWNWAWIILAVIIGAAFLFVFFENFAKGLGEGVAARA